jgi:hypothetical protein
LAIVARMYGDLPDVGYTVYQLVAHKAHSWVAYDKDQHPWAKWHSASSLVKGSIPKEANSRSASNSTRYSAAYSSGAS